MSGSKDAEKERIRDAKRAVKAKAKADKKAVKRKQKAAMAKPMKEAAQGAKAMGETDSDNVQSIMKQMSGQ